MAENKETLSTVELKNERLETRMGQTGLVDVEARTHVPENVKSWLEKVEEEQIVSDVNDSQGKPILQPISPTTPKTTLPTTKRVFMSGFKKTFSDAGRWLSVFVLRLIKIKKGRANFLEE